MPELGLTKKLGPLPVWAWGILGGVAVYFLYTRYKASSANAAVQSPVATALDPNAVDPTTGLTYGQELAGAYPTAGGVQSAADGATTGTAGGLSGFDSELTDFLTTLTDFGSLAQGLGFTPPQPSDNSLAAAASPPLDNTAPVATTGSRPAASAITTHAGGPFYKYYQAVTGHAPPQTVNVANPIYQMWKAGAKVTATKNPASHRAKTIHAANPQPHQHQVSVPKSNAKPVPVHRPAGGGHPGAPASGNHDKPTTSPSRTGRPISRAPAPGAPHHPAPPKPKPRRR